MIGGWWNTFQGWYVWQWPGWVTLGAIGTVGALFALYLQTHRLGQQLALERRARQEDERVRRETSQRANTPYLSMEARLCQLGPDRLFLVAFLHADGVGVVHNIVSNISRTTPPVGHMTTAQESIRYMRGNDEDKSITFPCHLSNVDQLLIGPLLVEIDVSFLNQFDQQIQFTQHGSVEAAAQRDNVIQNARFTITDAPQYKWPWDEPATLSTPQRKKRLGLF